MTEFLNGLLRWWPLPFFLIQMIMAWGMWSLAQKFVSRTDCKDCKSGVEDRGEKSNNRLAALESNVNALPSRDEVRELSDKIGRLSEKLGRVDGRLIGINRAVDLLNQHHLRMPE